MSAFAGLPYSGDVSRAMRGTVAVAVCAVLVGVAIGRIDAVLLERFQGSEPQWFMVLAVFAGAAATIPATLFATSFSSAAGFAVLSLAI
jgi:F0F1-type ATP synthase assembly protein I